jgi:uncharacterized caspase-like protein
VIGNAEYKVGPLQNPVNDAVAVAEAFETRLKFDKVMLRKNLDRNGFRAALNEMSHESADAELGVVYFAGHGIEGGIPQLGDLGFPPPLVPPHSPKRGEGTLRP